MAKPALILVGADKGGVGKTTVARTLLDYFTAHNVPRRAFDTEAPKGTLKRFHRDVSELVDVTAVADQMRIIDSFSAYMSQQPGGRTEVHSWINQIFAEFRELELQLLIGELESSLRGGSKEQVRQIPKQSKIVSP
jgi:CO dehydrogenase nickel-insertion accessory protein CooC1